MKPAGLFDLSDERFEEAVPHETLAELRRPPKGSSGTGRRVGVSGDRVRSHDIS